MQETELCNNYIQNYYFAKNESITSTLQRNKYPNTKDVAKHHHPIQQETKHAHT